MASQAGGFSRSPADRTEEENPFTSFQTTTTTTTSSSGNVQYSYTTTSSSQQGNTESAWSSQLGNGGAVGGATHNADFSSEAAAASTTTATPSALTGGAMFGGLNSGTHAMSFLNERSQESSQKAGDASNTNATSATPASSEGALYGGLDSGVHSTSYSNERSQQSSPSAGGASDSTAIATPTALAGGALLGGLNSGTHTKSYLNAQGQESAEDVQTGKDFVDTPATQEDVPAAAVYQSINPGDAEALHDIARQMSRTRSFSTRRSASVGDAGDLEKNADAADVDWDDEVLDPASEHFNLQVWLTKMLGSMNEGGIKIARTGVAFKDVNVSGKGSALNIQGTVGSLFTAPLRIGELFKRQPHKRILRNFDGLIRPGELLIVLGRPGSGCSTLLKTLTGEHHGLHLDSGSVIHYNGLEQAQMLKEFKGEVIYNQEVDKHFPHLTVGETLEHAAAMRTPEARFNGRTRKEYIKHMTQVVMAIYGLSHTYNTKVGDDFVRGVSGGERKRVSIAEMALAGTAVAAWDNSTRGLDAATALKFTQSLRQSGTLAGSSHAVAAYQASQAIYDLFDKTIVLYEGREIFFGRADKAKAYFETMGWFCPTRQTTGDFLTSVTNPVERVAREGYENKVPRTPDEFDDYWRNSAEYAELKQEIEAYEQQFPVGNDQQLADMREMKGQQHGKHTRPGSPYVVSIPMQISLNAKRAWQRIWNNKSGTFTPVIGNIVLALIIGSVYYGTPSATAGFQALGAALFFAILINALTAISEINSLYAQRPIVEKHKSYAFYHPWTEAIAGVVLDIPIKFATAVCFNLVLYFMVGLRREPAQFFLFFLIAFMATFVMTAVFRTVAATTKTVSQAMAFAGVLVLAIVVYTGFVVPTAYMKVWFSWIRWINPIYYAFEILIANEFHARDFTCSAFVPSYPGVYGGEYGDSFICSSEGAIAGVRTVNGDDYIAAAYNYHYSHVWRNFGILIGFLIAFMATYFVAVELNSSTSSTAEVLVFRRGHVPAAMQSVDKPTTDEEHGVAEQKDSIEESGETAANVIPPQKDVFTWRHVNYDIEIKGEPRRLLDDVSGWVKPGTLTALMGTSGAGKTTLLDVLAQRTKIGVITGSMFVNGASLDASFQRKTGYVQQQDLHLETSTVREALRFSAILRQPADVPKQEKLDYVEDVIKMLNMEEFSEAVVGVPGQGLNVEQRKLLTIGVELAAKPKLLLFLDEPTSGLDSQSSWAICAFLRKLADAGQAVLCTIHQPSAILFQQFDRLLFLRKGGKTVYFGQVGENSRTLLDYFESNGARKCGEQENPAEYMLEICAEEKWVGIWNGSNEAQEVQKHIDQIHEEREGQGEDDNSAQAHKEFAMPFSTQLFEVTRRVFQQYWRMPAYILAKVMLAMLAGLFIGFSFYQANTTKQGMQNVLYALFMVLTIFSTLVQQIMPLFVTQRSLYEVRERPSKAYSWKAFLIANILVEIPWQILAGIVNWATFYYPVVGIQSSERQALVLLFMIAFYIFASTFAHMTIAALPDPETAGAIVTLLFAMTLIFNGVFQSPTGLPGFWIFMYRVSPLTYWVAGISGTMLHGRQVECSSSELSIFNPPAGQTCSDYLAPYLSSAGGNLTNPGATSNCGYCSLTNADQFLAGDGIEWDDRWRNFGLMWAYIVFNIFIAVVSYWAFRVRTSNKSSKPMKSKGKKKDAGAGAPAAANGDSDANTSSGETKPSSAGTTSDSDDAEEKAAEPTNGLTRAGSQYLKHNRARASTNPRNAAVF